MFAKWAIIFLSMLTVVSSNTNVLDVAKQNGCGKIVQLLEDAGLAQDLRSASEVTLFAPSDAVLSAISGDVLQAFGVNKTLMQDVLKFHASPSVLLSTFFRNDELVKTYNPTAMLRINVYNQRKTFTADGSVVTQADLVASNGVVHIIDKLMSPIPSMNIPLYLTFDKDLSDLGYMVYQAKLLAKLGGQSFTIFAPSNEAIKKLSGQEYNDLLVNITKLTDVLMLHVVQGTIYSAGLRDGESIKSLQGSDLGVKISSVGDVTVNGAKVLQANLKTTNGVIHVIDTLLMPSTQAMSLAQTSMKIKLPVVG